MKIRISNKLDWEVTPNQDYDVLELDILWKEAAGELVYFRLISDRGSVEYVPFTMVTTSLRTQDLQGCSITIPEGWVADVTPGLICTIGPQELSRGGYQGEGSFWEDFYDDEGDARLILAKLLKEQYPESYLRYVACYGDATEQGEGVSKG